MNTVVIIVVALVIALQVYFFLDNKNRMEEYRDVFEKDDTWLPSKDDDGLIKGIYGEGNDIFNDIKTAINKYLSNNRGSVIDFHLLKDAVDRNCESREDAINAQMPFPLYCGLAGTMLGVILGLSSLLWLNGNGLSNLMSGDSESFVGAADGVSDLLTGVAIAMLASVCGIFFTTYNSYKFKEYKYIEERGKNNFLAWMQSKLLPELPSNTGAVIQQLVSQLNFFNDVFSLNINTLSDTFDKVNSSYKEQAKIIQLVHDMDVAKMANANIKVWNALQNGTDKLEQFNEYLDKLEEYLNKMDEFNLQFSQQAKTQEIFQKIADYFNRSKAYLSKDVVDSDKALQKALTSLKDSSSESITELRTNITAQSTEYMKTLEKEREAFEKFSSSLRAQFDTNMQQLPSIAQKLDEISKIPNMLSSLANRIAESNSKLESNMITALKKLSNGNRGNGGDGHVPVPTSSPFWMKIVVLILMAIIAVCLMFDSGCKIYELTHTQHNVVAVDSTEENEIDTASIGVQ